VALNKPGGSLKGGERVSTLREKDLPGKSSPHRKQDWCQLWWTGNLPHQRNKINCAKKKAQKARNIGTGCGNLGEEKVASPNPKFSLVQKNRFNKTARGGGGGVSEKRPEKGFQEARSFVGKGDTAIIITWGRSANDRQEWGKKGPLAGFGKTFLKAFARVPKTWPKRVLVAKVE